MLCTVHIARAEANYLQAPQLTPPQKPAALLMAQQVPQQQVLPIVVSGMQMPSASNANPDWWHRTVTMKSKPGTQAYRFMDDMTFSGLPLIAAGVAVRDKRAAFRQDYNNENGIRGRLLTNFHSRVDDYTQVVPVALTTALNLAGYEGRHTFPRYIASAAASYAIMAAIVNPIKYSVKEMRPDGSTANSFPSGHTATSFVSATILHKEYGLTRSPWFSIGGYALATATGVMRVLNNRHWVSDIFAGAGIGILSTELAYGLGDLLFKGKGINRNDLEANGSVIENPTFFGISMGMGFGNRNLSFDIKDMTFDEAEDGAKLNLKFQPATVVGAEAAYFFNRYVGVGGRLRVAASSMKGWDKMMDMEQKALKSYAERMRGIDMSSIRSFAANVDNVKLTIESDHLTEFAGDVGVYFNLPLSRNFALGSKLLIGRSVYQSLLVTAHAQGNEVALNPLYPDESNELLIEVPGHTYDHTWDYLVVSGDNTIKYGTGLSLTYAYKNNIAWKLFADYDYARKRYTMETDVQRTIGLMMPSLFDAALDAVRYQTVKQHHNRVTVGAMFTVSF